VADHPDLPYDPGSVDLHSHTSESDGTLSPRELIELAKRSGLDALAITDHDTFSGYQQALPVAEQLGLPLLCGIELNTRFRKNEASVHLLAYFPAGLPGGEFSDWLSGQQIERRNRNRKLVENLQSQGLNITLEEVERRGRSLAGRPHFARILVDKGYASDHEDAFRRYIGEDAPAFVERQSMTTSEAIRVVRAADGIPVIAHPVRLKLSREAEGEFFRTLKDAGLLGLEVYHSEHSPTLQAHYRQLAEELHLLPTGGSDFHGSAKAGTELGTGVNGNIRVPKRFFDNLIAYPLHPVQ
jgi:predicted metal-dependent phosphoesterase TrpH